MTDKARIAPLFPATASGRKVVVAACAEEMEAYGLSIAQAAREMGKGVSQTTLSKWLRGVYGRDGGDDEAVTCRVSTWLETRREARRIGLHGAGLDRHVDLGVTEEIEAALAHAQAHGDLALVHGRSGAGKSWAAQRYCSTRIAAYRIQVTVAMTTPAGLLSRLADAVGAGGRHPSALAAETALVEKMQGRGALIVVDEAHHLAPRLLDELRCIRDVGGCGLAMIGGDDLWTTLASSRRCDQIVGRIGVRLPLGAPAQTDVLDLAAGIMGRRPSTGESKSLIAAARSAGGLHALRRLMARAWVSCQAAGRDRIEAGDLELAKEAA